MPRVLAVIALLSLLLTGCVSRQDSAGAQEAPVTVPLTELSGVTLNVGDQKGGTSSHRRLVQSDFNIGIAPDHMFTCGKRKALTAPLQPAQGSGAFGCSGVRDVKRLTAERIAESVRCSHEKRTSRTVSEGLTNLSDQVGEIRLGNERFGPQPLLQRVLRKNLRPIQDQRSQQLESLRRQVDVVTSSRQLSRVQIEDEWAKAERHGSCLDKT